MKKYLEYFRNNPTYNALIHLTLGMGIGILITYPLVRSHPLRVGLALVVVGIVGHLYPLMVKR
jgi:hypothetical protein